MEDFERMQFRENQRQELLAKLKDIVSDGLQIEKPTTEDETSYEDYFYWGLITSIISHNHGCCEIELGNEPYRAATDLFEISILPIIEEFTHVQAEHELILAELLKYIAEEISRGIYQEFLRLSVPPGRDAFLREIGLDKMEQDT